MRNTANRCLFGLWKPLVMKGKKLDLTGKRFGKLVVLDEVPERRKGYVCWRVQCDCGSPEKVYSTAALTSRSIKPTRSCGCLWKKPFGESAKHRLLRRYQRNARTKNRAWKLTDEHFFTLTKSNCHYCGCAPAGVLQNKETNGPYVYNGIDRKDDAEGYFPENVVPCCRPCNWAKRCMSYAEFMAYIRQLVHYHNEKGTFTPLFRNQVLAAASR
jgi:hypothetical protein